MAMKSCKECGNAVSTSAKHCPHCGKQRATGGLTFMAKMAIGLFAAFVVVNATNGSTRTRAAAESPQRSPTPLVAYPPAAAIAPAPVVNILKLVRRSPTEVDRLLGKPTTIRKEKTRHGYVPVREYANGTVQVTFINGKADDFVIKPQGVAYDATAALNALGLPYSRPAFSNESTIRWTAVSGLRDISVSPMPGGIDFIEVLVDHGLDY